MSTRTRAELMQLMQAHKAAATALEAELKGRAINEYEAEGTAVTWRLPGGRVQTGLTHDAVSIVDLEKLTAFVAAAYPHQVREVTHLEIINQQWLTQELLGSFEPVDPAELEPGQQTFLEGPEGITVPGVVWTKGGRISSVSVVVEPETKQRLAVAAKQYAQGAGPMPGITSGGEKNGD